MANARRSKSLDALLPVLYLRGLSMGDFQEALAAILGPDAPTPRVKPEGSEAEKKTPWGGVFLPNELVGFQVGGRESARDAGARSWSTSRPAASRCRPRLPWATG